VRLVGECARCLDRIDDVFVADVQELFVYPERREAAEDSGDPELDALPRIEGDLIDLEPILRDAVVLALPLSPLCQEDCAGLCVECGARLADDPGHQHDAVDPRWAALLDLTTDRPDPVPGDQPKDT
jgi:uncharacterized protein